MPYSKDFFKRFCQKTGLSEDFAREYSKAAEKINSSYYFLKEYNKIFESCRPYDRATMERAGERMASLAAVVGVNGYTLNGVLIIHCFEGLEKEYIKRGVPLEIYWDTAADFVYKTRECIENKGVVGIFVPRWYGTMMALKKLALGRFQYDRGPFPYDFSTSGGIKIKEGTPCLYFHIPSSNEPITDEVRLDSYKKAYEFFEDIRVDGNIILVCHSWLLDPALQEILPANSNVARFLNDFEIMRVERYTYDEYGDAWRIFGPLSEGDLENWPENTSMQRAIKKHFSEGKKLGVGEGVIIFDGEKIVR